MSNKEVWVFGYGSLIWYRPKIKDIEEKIGFLEEWHRDWTWISSSRHGAPTCSLQPGGRVKGVFFRLDPKTQESDLEMLRKRELASSEEIVTNVCGISGEVHFWKMNNNLAKYEDMKGLTGMRLYEALARRAKSILIVGPDGKTPEEYALAVHKFDPSDEITKVYVNELQKLSESDEKRDPSQVIQAVSGRIESLKANRNFFTVLFAIESAMLTIITSFLTSLINELWISAFCLLSTLALTLFAIYALTDSIHFYSKYVEYRYAWSKRVHGEAYSETSLQKATNDYRRALEADDIGYYYLKLSLVTFLWFLTSFVYVVPTRLLDFWSRTIIFVSVAVFLTFVAVITYKETHRKSLLKACKDFFIRSPVFQEGQE